MTRISKRAVEGKLQSALSMLFRTFAPEKATQILYPQTKPFAKFAPIL